MRQLQDDDWMPYGKHSDKKMANVPASYLLWCYENKKIRNDVAWYVERNMDVLKEEVKREQLHNNK